MNYNEIGQKVLSTARVVGEFIIEQRKTFTIDKAESKGHQDFVSYVDKESERKIVASLKLILPGSGFIAEEQSAEYNNEEYVWIIDPLDGTTNYIHGVAPHAISIALRKGEDVVLGVVYELTSREIFYSWEGIGAFCNDKPISVSKATNMKNGLISTGFPINDFSRLDKHLLVIEQVVRNSHGVRRYGSAATDLAYVAAGRFDGFFEYGLNVWDLAAGAYLVLKAGGKVSDYSGGKNFYFGRELCAGTPGVYSNLVELLSKTMF